MKLTLRPIRTVNIGIYSLMVFLGVIFSEIWYFTRAISSQVGYRIVSGNYEIIALITVGLGVVLLISYLIARDFFGGLKFVVRSKRWELLIPVLFGIFLSYSFGGIGKELYLLLVKPLSIFQLWAIITAPFIFIILVLVNWLRAFNIYKKPGEKTPPFFISDNEKEELKDDLLGYDKRAEKFAQRVLNRGSLDSLVFGIDAPWGIGKSTFINFCKRYWEKNDIKPVIIYTFNPLRYETRDKLIEKFVDGLVRSIQKELFLPEIRPLLSKYLSFFRKNKWNISFHGLNVELLSRAYTADEALEDLKDVLKRIDKKIIVIVDDLDRVNFSSIKDVLFVINKSFTLPNLTYVLCYDTENINALERERPEAEKVSEFFEKFVNVKIGLFVDVIQLENFVSENQIALQSQNPQVDPILVGQVMGALKDIFNSSEYHGYLPFIGDIRKLKRLMNLVILLEIEKTDFFNSDFNKVDLIHLLLIYTNYPNIFRKIFNTETHDKRGFFSALTPFDDDYPKPKDEAFDPFRERNYKNSESYEKYVGTLSSDQKFLLDKVFDVKTRLPNDAQIDNVPDDIKKSYACFNGGILSDSGRNLEEYLNLIVNQAKPEIEKQNQFYLNKVADLKRNTPIDSILAESVFAPEKGELNHERLWRAILNNLHEFDGDTGQQLIKYVLENITSYSFFSNNDIGVGFRDDLSLFLVKMLDTVGWKDQNNGHRENDDDNIKEIAEWVFGDGRHTGEGVIDTLSQPSRGIIGLYDLLCFRLFCSADRGGDIFNLSRAIAKHSNPQAPSEGSTQVIAVEEMREVSQRVFDVFKGQYIDTKTNIFKLVDNLKLSDLAGNYHHFITNGISEHEEIASAVERHKIQIITFIIYQLGNSEILSGVGCGYYDQSGKKDNKGIKNLINDYLFDLCFNPAEDEINYQSFLDYLLINFTSAFSRGERKYIPRINEFTKVLSKERLTSYWEGNRIAIKKLELTKVDKKIHNANYIANYDTDLVLLFNELDELLKQPEIVSTPDKTTEKDKKE